ncbi:MAG TPA: hypothetical protein VGM13_10535 [Thermoanaerobaculia bacterium]
MLVTSETLEAARPFTRARDAGAEARAAASLRALLSALKDAAGDAWAGAALGGALGRGEGATLVGRDGSGHPADPFEILAVLDAPVRDVPAISRRLARAAADAARARKIQVSVEAVARRALALLPPTLANMELLAARRVVDGPENLLPPFADVFRGGPDRFEGVRLLARTGAHLLAAERLVDRSATGARAREALRFVQGADLACGEAILISAGRWAPGVAAREAEIRSLGAESPDGPRRPGFHVKMSWTRFKDLVERHRAAAAALHEPAGPENVDARRQVARAGDRFMEVLRLYEEERLGADLPNWTEYAIALARRRSGAAVSELFGEDEEIEDAAGAGRVARKSARTWPLAERVAPAVAALVDWDPGDLPIVPVLLDLPDTASRDALRQRAIAWGETV